MKKKITAVLIAIAGIFGLAACKKDNPTISSVPSSETTTGPVESSSTEPSESSSTEPSESSSTEPSESSSTEPSESSSTEPSESSSTEPSESSSTDSSESSSTDSSESEDPSEVKHTVMFNTADGTPIESIEVVEGSKVEKPATDPTKVGHTFVNWYADAEYNTVFNFEESIITAETTIYAKWEINSYNVTFVVAGNESDLVIQINYNSKITEEIANPTKAGHKFVGWFKEAAGTTAFDFTTEVITEATSVYAKFESITFADFVEQSGIVYQNTFDEDQTVECVGADETPTGNIYGTTSANDLEFDELNSVTIANGKFNVLDKSTETTNGFILLEELLEYEKIEIIAEVTPTANNGSWSLFNLIDKNLAEIASMRTIDTGKMGYRVGEAGTSFVAFTGNTAINVFISLDLVNGKITFVYNGTSLGEVDINASNLKGIKIVTAGKASRDVLVDNLAVRVIASENSEIATALKDKVQAHFDSLAVETNYITNLEEINAALAAGLATITAAEDKSAIIAAYNSAIDAINAIKSDSTLALDAIKETAVADLKAYKNAEQYITNAVQLTDALAAGELAINAAKSEEAVAAALEAAKAELDAIKDDVAQLAIDIPLAIAELEAYKNAEDYTMSTEELASAIQNGKDAIDVAQISSEVWEALEAAKTAIDQIDTDVQLVEKKRTVACAELSNYAVEKSATIEDAETHADVIAQISATVISGSETINSGNSYEEIDAALAEAKAIIDTLVASTQKTLDDVKNESKTELENYANEVISLYDATADSELIAAINQKATEGYAAIDEQTTNTAAIEMVTEYKVAIDALVDADTLVKAQNGVVDAITTIATNAKAEIFNDAAKAEIDNVLGEQIGLIRATTISELDEAKETAVAAIAAVVTNLESTKFSVTLANTTMEAPEVLYGGTLTTPVNPTQANSYFVGWYSDAELQNEFNFETVIYDNITIYAKWYDAYVEKDVTNIGFSSANIDTFTFEELKNKNFEDILLLNIGHNSAGIASLGTIGNGLKMGGKTSQTNQIMVDLRNVDFDITIKVSISSSNVGEKRTAFVSTSQTNTLPSDSVLGITHTTITTKNQIFSFETSLAAGSLYYINSVDTIYIYGVEISYESVKSTTVFTEVVGTPVTEYTAGQELVVDTTGLGLAVLDSDTIVWLDDTTVNNKVVVAVSNEDDFFAGVVGEYEVTVSYGNYTSLTYTVNVVEQPTA